MRAAVHHRFGGPEVVRIGELPTPRPGAHEVLIRVHASTVSAADHRARAKDVPAGLGIPSSLTLGFRRPRRPVLGMDAVGTVVEVGARVTAVEVGDEVLAMLGARFGGHAEYAIADAAAAVARRPAALPVEHAAALVFGGSTALGYLRGVRLGPGVRVLINGASGAVGSLAVQLAADAGAHVTAVCSAESGPRAASLGAARQIDRRAADIASLDERFDVIMDCVGDAPFSRVGRLLAPGGALLLVAADLGSLLSARRLAARNGVTIVTSPGAYDAADLTRLAELATAGRIRPVIDRIFPFAEVASAHAYVDTGRKRGNVVLMVGG